MSTVPRRPHMALRCPLRELPSLGELKARHREDHLCNKCNHHVVCAMAKALDPDLLVTISSCLAFDSSEPDASRICELMPIEAMATQ